MPHVTKVFELIRERPLIVVSYDGPQDTFGYHLFCPNKEGKPVPFAFSMPVYANRRQTFSEAKQLISDVKQGLYNPRGNNNLATWIRDCFVWPDFMF